MKFKIPLPQRDNKYIFVIVVVVLLIVFASINSAVNTGGSKHNYQGIKQSDKYSVKVKQNGNKIDTFVFISEVSDVVGDLETTGMYEWQTDRTLSWTTFEFDKRNGEVEIEVSKIYGEKASEVIISPKSYGITPDYFDGRTVRFKLKEPGKKISVNFKCDDNIDKDGPGYNFPILNGLMIFADKMEKDIIMPSGEKRGIPKVGDEGVLVYRDDLSIEEIKEAKVIYFKPGVYDLNKNKDLVLKRNPINGEVFEKPLDGVMLLEDNQTMYISKGAYVYGAVSAVGKKGVALAGRGILSGEKDERWDWKPTHCPMVDFRGVGKGENVYIEGITFVEAPFHGIVTPLNTYIFNTKQINWRTNNDSMRTHDNTLIRNCFAKGSDDYFYAFSKTIIENCVLWPMWNGALFQLGWGDYGGKGTIIRNNDVINPEHTHLGPNHGIMASQVLPGSQNGDILVEDLRIEGSINALVNLHYNSRLTNDYEPPREGYIKNIVFRNINIEKQFIIDSNTRKQCKNIIRGIEFKGKIYYIEDIAFENLKIDGIRITSKNYKEFFDIDPKTTKNITIDGTVIGTE